MKDLAVNIRIRHLFSVVQDSTIIDNKLIMFFFYIKNYIHDRFFISSVRQE